MPHPKRIRLSIAGTAAVALASLPLGITPASAAKVTEGTTSSIGVIETSSDAQQLKLKTQSASTGLVAVCFTIPANPPRTICPPQRPPRQPGGGLPGPGGGLTDFIYQLLSTLFNTAG